MKYLLDTNSCIYLFVNEYSALTARVAEQPEGSLAISAITYAEIALGTYHGKPPEPRRLRGFLEEIILVPFDRAASEAYAKLSFKRGSFDRLIAAHAISLGLPLVSRNISDFAAIEGLRVEDWTK